MKDMSAKANAASRARGEAEYDFMTNLDADGDGFIDPSEAKEFFEAMGLVDKDEHLPKHDEL